MRILPALLSVPLYAALFACSKSGGQTGDEGALEPEVSYEDIASQQGNKNYQPVRDVAELAASSERIVFGRAVAVRAGRTIMRGTGPSPRDVIRTLVLEIAVEQTLKGNAAESLYLEFLAGHSEMSLPARPPEDRVIVFAVPVTHDWFTDAVVTGRGDGLPEGETLHQLTTPQGFVVETEDGGFFQPFERNDDALGSGSFESLVERIVDAVDLRDGGATSDGSMPNASALCDGSDEIRFAYEVTGGFLSNDDLFLAPRSYAFFYLRGDCHFVVSQGPTGAIREGDLSAQQITALLADVPIEEIARAGEMPDTESCPDAGYVRVLAPEGELSCTCGCPVALGDTILSAAADSLNEAWQAGAEISGPVSAVAYVPPSGIAWWQGFDEPQAWPLDSSLSDITVADAGSVEATSGRLFEDDDAASLRALRSAAQMESSTVQRFPVREGASGEVHALLVRDELPADMLQAIERLPPWL